MESALINQGLSPELAHVYAFEKLGMSPYSVYHPEVILAHPEVFNDRWLLYWGLK